MEILHSADNMMVVEYTYSEVPYESMARLKRPNLGYWQPGLPVMCTPAIEYLDKVAQHDIGNAFLVVYRCRSALRCNA